MSSTGSSSPLHITPATWITLSRPLLLVVGIAMACGCWQRESLWLGVGALVFIGLSAITDGLDGWVARRWGCESDFGAKLDAAFDKWWLGVATPACLVPLSHHDLMHTKILFGYLVVNISRDYLVDVYRKMVLSRGAATSVGPNRIGKARTVVYMVLGCYLLAVSYELLPGLVDFSSFIFVAICYVAEAAVILLTVISWINYYLIYSKALRSVPATS